MELDAQRWSAESDVPCCWLRKPFQEKQRRLLSLFVRKGVKGKVVDKGQKRDSDSEVVESKRESKQALSDRIPVGPTGLRT